MATLSRMAPIFAVRDLDAALAHYRRLGFDTRVYQGGGYAFASRDGIEIHLGTVPPASGHTCSTYLWVTDAEELAGEWRSAGVDVHAPEDTEWGQHEGAVVDPDGNVIRFGSPLRRVGDPNRHDGPTDASPATGLTRSFGWSDMFVAPEDDPRTEGGLGDERTTLVGYLRAYRLTIELKCSGLDAAEMARRSVDPSNLSLLGLVRHLTDVERHWFRRVLDDQDTTWLYRRADDRDAAFNDAVADPEVVASAWTAWREEVSFAERFVEQAPSLEVTGTDGEGAVISLREVLVHLIEEYARHAGHADLLREGVDGRVGQ